VPWHPYYLQATRTNRSIPTSTLRSKHGITRAAPCLLNRGITRCPIQSTIRLLFDLPPTILAQELSFLSRGGYTTHKPRISATSQDIRYFHSGVTPPRTANSNCPRAAQKLPRFNDNNKGSIAPKTRNITPNSPPELADRSPSSGYLRLPSASCRYRHR